MEVEHNERHGHGRRHRAIEEINELLHKLDHWRRHTMATYDEVVGKVEGIKTHVVAEKAEAKGIVDKMQKEIDDLKAGVGTGTVVTEAQLQSLSDSLDQLGVSIDNIIGSPDGGPVDPTDSGFPGFPVDPSNPTDGGFNAADPSGVSARNSGSPQYPGDPKRGVDPKTGKKASVGPDFPVPPPNKPTVDHNVDKNGNWVGQYDSKKVDKDGKPVSRGYDLNGNPVYKQEPDSNEKWNDGWKDPAGKHVANAGKPGYDSEGNRTYHDTKYPGDWKDPSDHSKGKIDHSVWKDPFDHSKGKK